MGETKIYKNNKKKFVKLLPKIFIASSSESKEVAIELRNQLNEYADVKCWFDSGIFKHGRTTIDDLIRVSKEFDIGVFVFNNDDSGTLRNKDIQFTRDNVLFEYGLFVSRVGTENSFLFHPKNIPNFHLPSDLLGLTNIPFDSQRELEYALRDGVKAIKECITQWRNEKEQKKTVSFFERFYKEEEPDILDNHLIDFNRSFNLLLYMFGKETFKEFRAFDLAFHRWIEAFKDKDKLPSQITNYSKEIISSVKQLFKTGRCTDFKRILVISENSVTSETMYVLDLIHKTESETLMSSGKGILETRVLLNPHEHYLDYRIINDFALFTGYNEEFAIVETTLNSLNYHATEPQCIILTDAEKLKIRKDKFDYFWNHESISIPEFINTHFKIDKNDTIINAYKLFFNYYNKPDLQLKSVSIIIETAYVELIRVDDQRRYSHIDRAFELLNMLSTIKILKNSIYLDTFINDFKPKKGQDIDCIESCEIANLNDDAKFNSLKKEVTSELNNRNSSVNIDKDSITAYYMTKTRNLAISRIKKAMADDSKKSIFVFDARKDGTQDIYIKLKNGVSVNIGYLKSGNVVPNCALLMAEHYFELFNFAYSKNPTHSDFWIFDFLLYSEKMSVGQGAETAFILYEWPSGVNVHILNCSYFEDGSGGGDIRHLGPYKF